MLSINNNHQKGGRELLPNATFCYAALYCLVVYTTPVGHEVQTERVVHAVAAALAVGTLCGVAGTVASPFQRTQHILATTTASSLRAAAERGRPTQRPLKAHELSLLQHFYESLCVLVERQRLSDPLSLLLVHKVKALLEEGVFLHRPLLQQVSRLEGEAVCVDPPPTGRWRGGWEGEEVR